MIKFKNIINKEEGGMMWYKNIFNIVYIINLLLLFFILYVLQILPPEVPLLYGMPYGADQLVKSEMLLLIPVLGVLINIFNFSVSKMLDIDLLKKILQSSSLIVTFLAVSTTLKIIFLVGLF